MKTYRAVLIKVKEPVEDEQGYFYICEPSIEVVKIKAGGIAMSRYFNDTQFGGEIDHDGCIASGINLVAYFDKCSNEVPTVQSKSVMSDGKHYIIRGNVFLFKCDNDDLLPNADLSDDEIEKIKENFFNEDSQVFDADYYWVNALTIE